MKELRHCIIQGYNVFDLISQGIKEYPEEGSIEYENENLMKIRLNELKGNVIGVVKDSGLPEYYTILVPGNPDDITKAKKTLEKLTDLHLLNFI